MLDGKLLKLESESTDVLNSGIFQIIEMHPTSLLPVIKKSSMGVGFIVTVDIVGTVGFVDQSLIATLYTSEVFIFGKLLKLASGITNILNSIIFQIIKMHPKSLLHVIKKSSIDVGFTLLLVSLGLWDF